MSDLNAVFYSDIYHPIQAGSIDGTDTAPHDNGVYRALLATSTGLYDPTGDPKAEGNPYCIVFVGRLSRDTTEATLDAVMRRYGRVRNLRLVRDIVTGASQGYAFVEFETEKEMRRAYEEAHHITIDGVQILVDYNRQLLMPGWIPRRLGGGLGGRKESGQLRFGGRDRPFRKPLRPIPQEELKKLGIPLPPEGYYMPRFAIPPLPKKRSDISMRFSDYNKSRSYDKMIPQESSRRSPEVECLMEKATLKEEGSSHEGDEQRRSHHRQERKKDHRQSRKSVEVEKMTEQVLPKEEGSFHEDDDRRPHRHRHERRRHHRHDILPSHKSSEVKGATETMILMEENRLNEDNGKMQYHHKHDRGKDPSLGAQQSEVERTAEKMLLKEEGSFEEENDRRQYHHRHDRRADYIYTNDDERNNSILNKSRTLGEERDRKRHKSRRSFQAERTPSGNECSEIDDRRYQISEQKSGRKEQNIIDNERGDDDDEKRTPRIHHRRQHNSPSRSVKDGDEPSGGTRWQHEQNGFQYY